MELEMSKIVSKSACKTNGTIQDLLNFPTNLIVTSVIFVVSVS